MTRRRGLEITGIVWSALLLMGLVARPAAATCTGDCDGSGSVSALELFTMTCRSVNCDGSPTASCTCQDTPVNTCVAGDANGSGKITALEIYQATQNSVDETVRMECGALHTPPLVESSPSNGAGAVPRTEWVRLAFDGMVSKQSLSSFDLACGGQEQGFTVSAIDEVVIVNPAGDLPESSECTVTWAGASGPAALAFTTASAAAAATVLYDRDDLRHLDPFPDDFWLAEDETTPNGARLSIPLPDAPSDVQTLYNSLLQEANQLDGFSFVAHLMVALSELPLLSSLPRTAAESLDPMASIGLFDITSNSPSLGQRIPFLLEAREDTSALGLTERTLLLFPSIPLEPGGRYSLVVTRRVRVDASRTFAPSPFFSAALSAPSPGESEAVARVRQLSGEVLEVLGDATPPIYADDVALAVAFTVRTIDAIPADLLEMKSQILAAPPPAATVGSAQPYGGSVAALVSGTWEAPNWRDGVNLARDEMGRPIQTGTQEVPFTLALPVAAEDGPVPVTIYQHGNPGSAENEVPGEASDYLADGGFAVIGFTDNINREVGSDISLQTLNIFGNLIFNSHIPDYWVETHAEQLAFVRMLESLADLDVLPLGAPDGVPDLDVTAPLTYVGISEGANHGQALLPYAPEIRAAALVVGGARLVETLIHQEGSDPQIASYVGLIGMFVPSVTATDVWVGFSLFQTIFDQQDYQSQARFLYREPLEVAGTTKKPSVLVLEGLDDSRVPNNGTNSLAWIMGPIPHLQPVQRPVPFLQPVVGPLVGNIDETTTSAFYQYVPAGVPGIPPTPGCQFQFEGHFCPQSAPESEHQRLVFFQSALTDQAPTIIDPLDTD